MSDKDYIKELFSDKLGNYEAKVNPELWTNIASQIGVAGSTAATTGITVLTKWIIGVSIASVVAVTAIVIVNSSEEESPNTENATAQIENNDSDQKQEIEDQGAQENKIEEEPVNVEVQRAEEAEGNIPTPFYVETLATVEFGKKPLNPEILPELSEKKPPVQEWTPKDEKTVDPVFVGEDIPVEMPAEKEENKTYFIGSLPNIFSPNGDGTNDYFKIDSIKLTNFSITVLSSDGKIVFQSNDPDFKWDGMDRSGSPVPDGRYVYYVLADEFAGDKPKRYSSLTIKRSR